ncbi:hypothetical protein [Rhodococcus kronopolitis]|uniref:Uncharacterized protein n=1 Tax=Rhodococcus kronopolitis TaxID=1460226 RepID=A0ABV9FWD1_9NOCA
MIPALTILALTLGAALLYVAARRSNGSRIFRLEQFRPAAPLVGTLPEERDATRARHDLDAVRTRQDIEFLNKSAPHH